MGRWRRGVGLVHLRPLGELLAGLFDAFDRFNEHLSKKSTPIDRYFF